MTIENNKAFMAVLKDVQPIVGADKIKKAFVSVGGVLIAPVVVSSDTPEGQEIVYFDSNMKVLEPITEKYPTVATYLGNGGRVRVVKLRNTISNGLVMPWEQLQVFDKKLKFQEGYSFLELGGVKVTEKYHPPVKHVQGPGKSKGDKALKKIKTVPIVEGAFKFHIDTAQFFRNVTGVSPNDVISISEKIHGSSFIVSNVLVKRELNVVEKILKFVGVKVQETEYKEIAASRTVVKTENDRSGFYKEDIWSIVLKDHFLGKLRKGETVYGEVFGYLPSGGMIQKGYRYGTKPGQYGIAVYRITQTDVDGNVVEHGWASMKERAARMCVPTVPELYFGKASDLFKDISVTEHWHENFATRIRETYLEKTREDCDGLPDEGVVIRVESGTITPFKAKSDAFFLHESKAHESGEEDTEEQESAV